MSTTPPELLRDLEGVGVHVTDLWDLVNAKYAYAAAVPVLLRWLDELDERIPRAEQGRLREGLVRSLTVREARPVAAPTMIREFRESLGNPMYGWAVGNALEVVADDSVFDVLEPLIRNRQYGMARGMIVWGLGRSKDPRAVPLLVSLLDDDTVAAHAAHALGRLKAKAARAPIEQLLNHPVAGVRREAKKALERIDSQGR